MKSCVKIIGLWLLAEILTLFLDLTLAFSGSTLVRLVCGTCTVGILGALMAQGGLSAARTYRKMQQKLPLLLLGAVGSVPALFLWAVLCLSRCGVLADSFYRWYKLLCAPFLSFSNLFSDGVLTSQMPVTGMTVLFVLSLLPGAAVIGGAVYQVYTDGMSSHGNQFSKKSGFQRR